jgi:hypothetical protein
MNELSHCVEMASMCRQCALEDEERKELWLAEAEKWNQRAGRAIGYSFKSRAEVTNGTPGAQRTLSNH